MGSLPYAFPRVVLLSPHIHVHVCMLSSSVTPTSFITPWTVAHQAPLSMGFPRQEYWSGWPIPSSGDLPDPGMESTSPVSSVCRWILYYGATWKPPQVHVFFPVLGNWTSSLHVLIGHLQSLALPMGHLGDLEAKWSSSSLTGFLMGSAEPLAGPVFLWCPTRETYCSELFLSPSSKPHPGSFLLQCCARTSLLDSLFPQSFSDMWVIVWITTLCQGRCLKTSIPPRRWSHFYLYFLIKQTEGYYLWCRPHMVYIFIIGSLIWFLIIIYDGFPRWC